MLPKGAKLINCAASPHLRQAMAPDSPRLNTVERGRFRITAPPGWSTPFCYGFDMRRPFEVEDLEILRRLNTRAKDIGLKQGFKVERLSKEAEADRSVFEAPEELKRRPGRPKKSAKPVVEGSDVQSKGAPLTTYSESKGA